MRRNPIWIVNFKPLEQSDRILNATLLCGGYRLLQFSFQLATQVRLAQRDLSGVHVAQLDQMVNRFTIVTLLIYHVSAATAAIPGQPVRANDPSLLPAYTLPQESAEDGGATD